jgi:hypothetical protein
LGENIMDTYLVLIIEFKIRLVYFPYTLVRMFLVK